jgi:hypothetical protein
MPLRAVSGRISCIGQADATPNAPGKAPNLKQLVWIDSAVQGVGFLLSAAAARANASFALSESPST